MIIVTGATGNVGRHLVAALSAAGHAVTAVSRSASPITADAAVSSVQADLTDPVRLGRVLTGAAALFLIVPGADDLDGPAIMTAAADAGVCRVVLLSSQAVGTRSGAGSHASLARLESAVRSSGLQWTILRPSGFASNDLAWLPTIQRQHTVYTPYADVALPVIDPRDIAEVAATALSEPGHDGRTYVLTGPAAISPRQRAAIIGSVIGRSVDVVELTHDQARAQLITFMPEAVADGTLDIIGRPLPTETMISPDLSKILGRPARPYAEWATEVYLPISGGRPGWPVAAH